NGSLVVEEQVLRKLLGNGRAALYDPAGARIGDQCSRRARKIDAEVFVKAPILCGEHGLDQMIGKLVERYRVIMFNAARADLVSLPIKKSPCQSEFLQPIVTERLAKRRPRQCQHHHKAESAEGGPF